MRIYYKFDYITDNRLNKCPFNEELHNEETRVGSISCQKCKYCYSTHEGGLVGYPCEINNFIVYQRNHFWEKWYSAYSCQDLDDAYKYAKTFSKYIKKHNLPNYL